MPEAATMPQIRVISDRPYNEAPVQLSELLARLSPDERQTLLDRRFGPNAVPLDNRALSQRLAMPDSTAEALSEVNAGQLLLLRWLAERPNLRASWTELTQAVGDRLAPEQLQSYLQDLRLWGLADFKSSPKDGFFATYPAVPAALATGRDVRLRARIELFTSDVLLKACQALGMTRPPNRKDERVDLIVSTLTTTESCRAAVSRLSKEGQQLFAWLRERGGWASAAEMNQRAPRRRPSYGYGYGYDTIDSFWKVIPKGEKLDPLTEAVRCMLIVPITPYAGGWYAPSSYAVATDVERAFSGRDLLDTSPLQPLPLVQAEEVTGTIPDPVNVLRDISHVLGFVTTGRCEWRQDGQPYKRSLVALGKLLGYKDSAYTELLWDLAAGAGLLRPARDFRFEPMAVGDADPDELLAGLVMGWIKSGNAAVPGTVLPVHAQLARVHAVELLQILPPDTWLLRSSVEASLRFHWPASFDPASQPIGFSVPELTWGGLGALLIGIGQTAAGQAAVMMPAMHQRLLAPVDEASGLLPPWERSWIVQPDRTIVAPPNTHPDAVVELWKVAQLQSAQGASVFRVTPESIAAALNRGLTPTEVRETLQGGSKVPLPPTVERLIEDQGKRFGRIKVGTAHTYVKVDDPALLAELKRHKKLSKLTWVDVAPGVAFVVSQDPSSVLNDLRQAGYLPVMEQQTEQPKKRAALPAPAPTLRSIGGSQRKGREPMPTVSGREALVQLVNNACALDMPMTVTWVNERGLPSIAKIEVIDLHDDNEIHGYNLDRGGAELLIPLDAVVDVVVEPDDDDEDYE
jgi:hypothetical protein